MPKCVRLKRKHRKVCVGDLDTEIILHDRAIQPIEGTGVTLGEEFTPNATVWAMLETLNGVTAFDSTNTEIVVTERFTIRFDPTVTAETWIELNGEYFDIIRVQDLERRNEWMHLLCNVRGSTSKPVNMA